MNFVVWVCGILWIFIMGFLFGKLAETKKVDKVIAERESFFTSGREMWKILWSVVYSLGGKVEVPVSVLVKVQPGKATLKVEQSVDKHIFIYKAEYKGE